MILSEKLKAYSRISDSGCWLWQKAITTGGYGKVYSSEDGRLYDAHRASYLTFIGPIPKGLVVRHSCDNPACCNPKHLSLGTQRDNIKDAMVRGRINFKLTEEMVEEIRSSSLSLRKAAAKYGVSSTTIHKIRGGVKWRQSSLKPEVQQTTL